MRIVSTMALISINETLIVQVVSFLIFLFIINRVMIRPLRNVMTDRDYYIENIRGDIQGALEKMKAIAGRIRQQEREVKKEAFKLKDELENSGHQRATEIVATARKDIAAMNARVKDDIDRQLNETRAALQGESEALAREMIEKILDRRLVQ